MDMHKDIFDKLQALDSNIKFMSLNDLYELYKNYELHKII